MRNLIAFEASRTLIEPHRSSSIAPERCALSRPVRPDPHRGLPKLAAFGSPVFVPSNLCIKQNASVAATTRVVTNSAGQLRRAFREGMNPMAGMGPIVRPTLLAIAAGFILCLPLHPAATDGAASHQLRFSIAASDASDDPPPGGPGWPEISQIIAAEIKASGRFSADRAAHAHRRNGQRRAAVRQMAQHRYRGAGHGPRHPGVEWALEGGISVMGYGQRQAFTRSAI